MPVFFPIDNDYRRLDLADWTLIGRRMSAEGREWCLLNVEHEVEAYLRANQERLDAESYRVRSAAGLPGEFVPTVA